MDKVNLTKTTLFLKTNKFKQCISAIYLELSCTMVSFTVLPVT